MFEMIDFSIFNLNHLKIFKSLISLEFKDLALEEFHKSLFNKSIQSSIHCIWLIIGILLWLMKEAVEIEFTEIIHEQYRLFIVFSFLLSFFVFYKLSCFTSEEILNMSIESCFIFLNSTIQKILNRETHVVALLLILKLLIRIYFSLNFNKSLKDYQKICLTTSLSTLSIGTLLAKFSLINHLIHVGFNLLEYSILYLFNFICKKSFYFLIKVSKEKDNLNQIINCNEISYFSLNNLQNIKMVKMDKIINNLKGTSINEKMDIKIIDLIFGNIYQNENSNNELDAFLKKSIKNKKFNFVKLIKIINSSKKNVKVFNKFTKLGIIKLNDENEDNYYQVFLKLTQKTNSKSIDNLNTHIVCIFKNVTFDVKNKNQINTNLILDRNIKEAKSSLILSEKLIRKYSKKINSYLTDQNNIADLNYITRDMTVLNKHVLEKIDTLYSLSNENEETLKQMDIRKTINECVDYFKILLKINKNKSTLKIFSEVEGNIPKFIKTKGSIKSILMNLISNAVNSTYNGEIKVGCKLISNFKENVCKFMEVYVSDTGVGIDEIIHDKCQKEQQVKGLGVINHLLEKIDSKLYYYSFKNKGSSFCFKVQIDEVDLTNENENKIDNNLVNTDFIPNNKENLIFVKQDFTDSDTKTVSKDFPLLKPEMATLDWKNIIELESPDLTNENFKNEQTIINNEDDNMKIYYRAQRRISKTSINSLKSEFSLQKKRSRKKFSTFNYKLKNKIIKLDNNEIQFSSNSDDEVNDNTSSHNFKNCSFDLNNQVKIFNILIIDDDPIYLNLTYDQIRSISKDFNTKIMVYIASDPIEGLCIIHKCLKEQNELFNLVLIDENMPFLSGSTFVKIYYEFLSKNGFYKIPFVSISSESVRFDYEKSKYFDSFLNKPTRKSDIKNTIRKYYELLL